MRLIRSWSDFKKQGNGIALAIGNFDGMHLGHQAVLEKLRKEASRLGLIPAVMTFKPHPRDFFRPDEPHPKIFTLRDKVEAFARENIDLMFCVRFDATFAKLEPEEFVGKVLCEKLGVRTVIVGSLFYFGKGGKASFADLKSLCARRNIEALSVDGVEADGKRVSSTHIRSLLLQGKFKEAADFLGRAYTVSGRIAHGNALGRTLGFPTANVELHGLRLPLEGVFAVRVSTLYGVFKGMCNAGVRPSVREERKRYLLEAYLFDFTGDLYGTLVKITFVKKIRDEQKFQNLDELKSRLFIDRQAAQDALDA